MDCERRKCPPREEVQLKSHLGSDATYSSTSEELGRWVSTLSRLSNMPRVSRTISMQLLMPLAASLHAVSKALDYAGNGVEWICTEKNFGTKYALSAYLTRAIALDSAREAAAITDAAKERLSQDIGTLQAAVDQATLFSADWPDLHDKISLLRKAELSAADTLKKLTTSAISATEDIEAKQESAVEAATASTEEIKTATDAFNEGLATANQALLEAQKIHLEAQKI